MLEPHAGYLHFGAAIQVAFRSHVLGGSCQITPPSDFFCSCRIENVVAAAATATALGGGTFQPPGLAQGQTGDRKRGVGPVVKLQDRDQHAGPPPRSQGKGADSGARASDACEPFPGVPIGGRADRSESQAQKKNTRPRPPAQARAPQQTQCRRSRHSKPGRAPGPGAGSRVSPTRANILSTPAAALPRPFSGEMAPQARTPPS